jgi:xanthine dehydrogenase molybdopterin-binding subunit B
MPMCNHVNACSGSDKDLQYSTFGAACTEVEINLLTGERRVLRSDVLHDAGESISPAVDMGQVLTL